MQIISGHSGSVAHRACPSSQLEVLLFNGRVRVIGNGSSCASAEVASRLSALQGAIQSLRFRDRSAFILFRHNEFQETEAICCAGDERASGLHPHSCRSQAGPVRLLESRFGFPLFRRQANSLELTDQGQTPLAGLTNALVQVGHLALSRSLSAASRASVIIFS